VLLVAFYYQFVAGELPCPLCALQRVRCIAANVGLALNLRVGYAPAHYDIALLSAVAAASAWLRQISLHVIPNTGHCGSALLGFHFLHVGVRGLRRARRLRRGHAEVSTPPHASTATSSSADRMTAFERRVGRLWVVPARWNRGAGRRLYGI